VRKHAAIAIKKWDEKYCHRIAESMVELSTTGNPYQLISIAEGVLSEFPTDYNDLYKIELRIQGRLATMEA
jgi:hypothetical protein